MRNYTLLLLLLITVLGKSENEKLLTYNLKTKKYDSLAIVTFDTLISQEKTSFSTGTFDNQFLPLDNHYPIDNLFPESRFTRKRRAALDFDINRYPIRTSIKMFVLDNDTLKQKCSGSIISKIHVLTACHCVAEHRKDSIIWDSILICPAYDNGTENSYFYCTWVDKVYFFKNWNTEVKDFSVLKLEDPIGEETGWISIGFNSDDSTLLDGAFYKFSYPAYPEYYIDSTEYNGDTLYYYYGKVDISKDNILGATNASALRGESGSSIIKIKNGEEYTSYGNLTYSSDITHNKLTNWKYYAFKTVIENDLKVFTDVSETEIDLSIYPNPASDYIEIKGIQNTEIARINIIDIWGRTIINLNNPENLTEINISHLLSGIYMVTLETSENMKFTKKIIKY